MNAKRPAVSFLVPVAGDPIFLGAALASLCVQTVEDWELVLILDGQGTASLATAREIVPSDRLHIVQLPKRLGISAALNAGLAVCHGAYVARLDADDVSHHTRLEIQLAALESWPEVAVLGGRARVIDEDGLPFGYLPHIAGRDIRRQLLWRNRLVHSSVVARTHVLRQHGGYNSHCRVREDYEFWLRVATSASIASVEEVVVDYRVSVGQMSRRRPTRGALASVNAARLVAADALGMPFPKYVVASFAWTLAQDPWLKRYLPGLGASHQGPKRLD